MRSPYRHEGKSNKTTWLVLVLSVRFLVNEKSDVYRDDIDYQYDYDHTVYCLLISNELLIHKRSKQACKNYTD